MRICSCPMAWFLQTVTVFCERGMKQAEFEHWPKRFVAVQVYGNPERFLLPGSPRSQANSGGNTDRLFLTTKCDVNTPLGATANPTFGPAHEISPSHIHVHIDRSSFLIPTITPLDHVHLLTHLPYFRAHHPTIRLTDQRIRRIHLLSQRFLRAPSCC